MISIDKAHTLGDRWDKYFFAITGRK